MSQLESQCQMLTNKNRINTLDECALLHLVGPFCEMGSGGTTTLGTALESLVWCMLLRRALQMLAGVQLAEL